MVDSKYNDFLDNTLRMTFGFMADLSQRVFWRCLTLLAALVLGALLVLAHDIVGIVH